MMKITMFKIERLALGPGDCYMDRFGRSCIHTKRAKLNDFHKFLTWCEEKFGRSPKVKDCTPSLICEYRDEQLQVASPATVARNLATLKHFFLKLEDYSGTRSPMKDVSPPVVPKRPPVELREGELEAFRKELLITQESRFKELRLHLYFEMGLSTGMRAGEMLSLVPEQIDWQCCKFRNVRCKGRGGGKYRDIDFPTPLSRYLKRYLDKRKFVIEKHHGNPLTSSLSRFPLFISINKAVSEKPESYRVSYPTMRRGLTAVGNKVGETLYAHKLRHDFGKRVARAFGVEVAKEALGHSDVNTTMIYVSSTEQEIKRAVNGIVR